MREHSFDTLVGDDLNDFTPAPSTWQERVRARASHDAFWGVRWIALPNPAYGSWERAVLQGSQKTEASQTKQRLQALPKF